MSSKILDRGRTADVASLSWRNVGALLSEPGESGGGQGTVGDGARRTSAGPTWEQYHSLEVRLRELEQQLPQREQQVRQTALREGEATAAARWESAIERLSRSIGDIAAHRPRLRREAEQDVVKLSLAIARRVLHRELSVDHDALLGLVKAAFEKLDAREVHRVRLRPEDVPHVTAWLDRIGSPSRIEVQADAGLERGGAIVETERGNLDVSLETQLQEIERGFTDLLESPPRPGRLAGTGETRSGGG